MRSEVTMPRLSDTMSEGAVDRWLKQPGDRVQRDEVIAEIQTDKATMELVAFEDGVLDEIVVPAGTTVPIGQVIGWIRTGGDAAAAAPGNAPSPSAVPSPPSQAAVVAAPALERAPAAAPASERIKASPLARRVARELAVDLAAVRGTGPGGRILKENVERFHGSAPPVSSAAVVTDRESAGGDVVPMTRMQQAMARTVSASKPGVPHIYLTVDVDMTAAMALRAQINDSAAAGVPISPNDLLVMAAARALTAHPLLNSRYVPAADGAPGIARSEQINVSVAVATDRGLLAPVVRDADRKSLGTIAAEIRDLAGRARAGASRQSDLDGATFQTSNLGMFGVREFVSIITPPQAASLAIGAVRAAPCVRDGRLEVGQLLSVTLSVDHRVADGAAAARFLQELTRLLQAPLSLLV